MKKRIDDIRGKNMKKTVIYATIVIISICLIPVIPAEYSMESQPELETYVITGLGSWVIKIHVKNTGDSIAHNVSIKEIEIEGHALINFQESTLWSVDLAPGEWTILDPNSLIIGFGMFTISLMVSCDEESSSTSSVTGILCGPFFFIP